MQGAGGGVIPWASRGVSRRNRTRRGLSVVCEELGIARSMLYAQRIKAQAKTCCGGEKERRRPEADRRDPECPRRKPVYRGRSPQGLNVASGAGIRTCKSRAVQLISNSHKLATIPALWQLGPL